MHHRIHHPHPESQAIKSCLRMLQDLAYERAAARLVPILEVHVYSVDQGELVHDDSDPEHVVIHAMRADGSGLQVEVGIQCDVDVPAWIALVMGEWTADGAHHAYERFAHVDQCSPLWLWLHEESQLRELQECARRLIAWRREAG